MAGGGGSAKTVGEFARAPDVRRASFVAEAFVVAPDDQEEPLPARGVRTVFATAQRGHAIRLLVAERLSRLDTFPRFRSLFRRRVLPSRSASIFARQCLRRSARVLVKSP